MILNPGPVWVPDFVLDAIRKPVIHQRSSEFSVFFQELQEGLRYFFQTKNTVVSMPGSGTSGMESSIRSLFKQKDKVLVVSFGKFSSRWAAFSRISGLEVSELKSENGKRSEPGEMIEAAKIAGKNLRGIILTHCETSTGASIDVEQTAFLLRKEFPDILIIADAITSAGILPFYTDNWEIDIAVAASQKSLLNPAGTVFISVSQRAARTLSESFSEDAFNLSPYYFSALKNEYPFTPPTQRLFGVLAALNKIQSETLPVIWNRTHRMSTLFRKGIVDLGGFVFPENPADSLTAFYFKTQTPEFLTHKLKKEFDIEISEGQGDLKGQILRVAHFGAIGPEEMLTCLDSIRQIIKGHL